MHLPGGQVQISVANDALEIKSPSLLFDLGWQLDAAEQHSCVSLKHTRTQSDLLQILKSSGTQSLDEFLLHPIDVEAGELMIVGVLFMSQQLQLFFTLFSLLYFELMFLNVH